MCPPVIIQYASQVSGLLFLSYLSISVAALTICTIYAIVLERATPFRENTGLIALKHDDHVTFSMTTLDATL